jgi:hypothetical protein
VKGAFVFILHFLRGVAVGIAIIGGLLLLLITCVPRH